MDTQAVGFRFHLLKLSQLWSLHRICEKAGFQLRCLSHDFPDGWERTEWKDCVAGILIDRDSKLRSTVAQLFWERKGAFETLCRKRSFPSPVEIRFPAKRVTPFTVRWDELDPELYRPRRNLRLVASLCVFEQDWIDSPETEEFSEPLEDRLAEVAEECDLRMEEMTEYRAVSFLVGSELAYETEKLKPEEQAQIENMICERLFLFRLRLRALGLNRGIVMKKPSIYLLDQTGEESSDDLLGEPLSIPFDWKTPVSPSQSSEEESFRQEKWAEARKRGEQLWTRATPLPRDLISTVKSHLSDHEGGLERQRLKTALQRWKRPFRRDLLPEWRRDQPHWDRGNFDRLKMIVGDWLRDEDPQLESDLFEFNSYHAGSLEMEVLLYPLLTEEERRLFF